MSEDQGSGVLNHRPALLRTHPLASVVPPTPGPALSLVPMRVLDRMGQFWDSVFQVTGLHPGDPRAGPAQTSILELVG